jgi:protein-S-isoprenylcysteine O-methyltransferase Ste14
MFARAAFAFIALPGLFAILVPATWLWLGSDAELVHPLGLVPLLAGFVALLWCVRDFYVSGKGTLAPWSPPAELVVAGLYRHSRNPMYIALR